MTPATKRTVLWVCLAVFGAYLFGECQPTSDDARLDALVAQQIGAGRAFQASLKAQQDSTSRLNQALAVERLRASRARHTADSLRGVGDSLSDSLRGAQNAGDSLTIAVGLIETLRQESGALRGEVSSLEGQRDSLTSDRDRWQALAVKSGGVVDSLSAALLAVNQARHCRVLGLLSCPSRKTAYLLGALTGVALTVVVSR